MMHQQSAGWSLLALAYVLAAGIARAQAPGPTPEGHAQRLPSVSSGDTSTDRDVAQPKYPSAIDPVTSAPTPGPTPGLTSPKLDVLGATVEASKDGAIVSGVIAPFWFLDAPKPLLSDTRVDIHGGSAILQPAGFVLSTGYSSATSKLGKLSGAQLEMAIAKCKKPNAAADDNVIIAADALAAKLTALPALPTPPLAPLSRMQGETASAYRSRVHTAFQKLDKGQQEQLRPYDDTLTRASNVSDDTFGDCWIKGAARARMKRAYGNAFAVRVFGGADVFPYVSGPKVAVEDDAMPGAPATEPAKPPVPHVLSSWNAGASVGFFTSRDFRVWLTGSFARARKEPSVEALSSRLGVGVDVAGNIGIGEIDADGFQPGFVVGGFATLQRCLESVGCDEVVAGYADPLKTSRITTAGAFIDVRSSTKVQLRLGLPVTVFRLASAPDPASDTSRTAWGFAPTVSLTVASWVLMPSTTH
jgi:hypothetical protein